MTGVSVIVCSYNGANRIGQTLRHLVRQEAAVPWEVIVVDNASTDGTGESALRAWPTDAPMPLRVFHEPTPGYNYAADRGIAQASYGIIAHVHDDNWVVDNWITRVASIFESNPEIGACGGAITATFESAAPPWFNQFQEYYAVGSQWKQSEDITWSRGYLWGAGLCLRKRAWMDLKRHGFQFRTSGRRAGRKLISGEDSELCFALRLAGWKLWYSNELHLTHYLRATELDWRYLRRLSRSFGEASAQHDCYWYPLLHEELNLDHIWRDAVVEALCDLLKMPRQWRAFLQGSEGSLDVLLLERQIGRTVELIRMRETYAETHRAIFNAKWRTLGSKLFQLYRQPLVQEPGM